MGGVAEGFVDAVAIATGDPTLRCPHVLRVVPAGALVRTVEDAPIRDGSRPAACVTATPGAVPDWTLGNVCDIAMGVGFGVPFPVHSEAEVAADHLQQPHIG